MVTPMGDFHHPFFCQKPDFEDKMNECVKLIEEGLTPQDACVMVIGVLPRQYRRWVNMAIDDLKAGFDAEESNLIKFITALAKADASLHQKLSGKAVKLAVEDEDPMMLKFLLQTRYDYSTKKDIEVSSNEDAPVAINIIDMQPVNEDNTDDD